VTNNGDRAGAHVVQVYAVLPDPEAPPRLAGFARVEVASGDRRAFEILVPTDRLATRDTAARGWRSPTGIHRIVVGTFAGDLDATEVDVDLGA
jgi:beta-glucosidase